MTTRAIVFSFLTWLAGFQPVFAMESMEIRIANAVKRIVGAQFSGGESAAIETLKTCYQKPLVGAGVDVVLQIEECVAQDIAYANFSAGMYRRTPKTITQPEYVTIDAMKARVYSVVLGGGLSKEDADKFLRIVASIAIDSLVPAIQSHQGN